MMKKENIKEFVKETLGCDCPENVFTSIDSQLNVKLNNDILLNSKINIGNRLLIHVIEVNDSNSIKSNLSTLVSMGKRERDRGGFNRFRLVLITDKMNEIRKIAYMIFKNLEDKDEKVHLHVIDRNEMSVW
ncbi:MAG: hypothetical protein ACFFCD_15190 [Promethearchaeota archaeon]